MSIYHGHQIAFAGLPQSDETACISPTQHRVPSWFRGIPPERIGLDGKYDHCGLQKRVEAAFEKCGERYDSSQLFVSQRGRVVVLQGRVPDQETLNCLIGVAEQVDGGIRVEVAGVSVAQERISFARNFCQRRFAQDFVEVCEL